MNKNQNWNGNMFIIIPLLVCVIISICVPIAFYCLFTNINNDKEWCSTIPNLFTTDGLYNIKHRFEAGSIIIFIFIWVITLITWIFVIEFIINAIILKKNYKNTYLVRTIDYFRLQSCNKISINNNNNNLE
tara:strand:- start:2351 stop:2743 length:393 start_codon:yes stop_codon:yes gene_type:complete